MIISTLLLVPFHRCSPPICSAFALPRSFFFLHRLQPPQCQSRSDPQDRRRP